MVSAKCSIVFRTTPYVLSTAGKTHDTNEANDVTVAFQANSQLTVVITQSVTAENSQAAKRGRSKNND